VRPAAADDAVAGVTPRYAASPATVAEVSRLLCAAAGHGLAVVVRGSGTKLGWGPPPTWCDLLLSTGKLNRVLEHAKGDLVARVQAGVPLRRLAGTLARAGQLLALDPPPAVPGAGAAAAGTAGGALAAGAAGPRRLRYGTPRDLVIGVTVVRPDGTVARSGGKVVKNVAGYDLGKLFAGSLGTLGVIVEAVFRLHPLPAAAAYVSVACPGGEAAQAAVAAVLASELAPSAVEIDRPAVGQPVQVAVLLEGGREGVRERARALSALLGPGARTGAAPPWWGWAHGPLPGGAAGDGGGGSGGGKAGGGTLVRVAFWAGALARVLGVIDAAAGAAGVAPAVGGSAASGVIYAALGPGARVAAVAEFVTALRAAAARGDADAGPVASLPGRPPALASAVVVQAPPALAARLDPWGPVPALSLMRAVKDQFDPGHQMAPGRFVGGI
jgi:glycolate oxidase FAD binding subunit